MNNKLQKIVRVVGLVCFLLLCRVFLTQCAGITNLASPQSSIPLPNAQDPITVSAPDADGNVKVIGSAGAVPNSAIVVIKVGVSLDADIALPQDSLNVRTTCSSDLPECPALDANSQCQSAANDDGSFSLSVPATADENILVSYLALDTCEETTAYTVTVDNRIISIPYEVRDAIYSGDYVSLIGTDTMGEDLLINFNLSDHTVTTSSLAYFVGDLTAFDYFVDGYSNPYLALMTADNVVLAPLNAELGIGSVESGVLKDITISDGGAMAGGQFLDLYSIETIDELGEPTKTNQVFFFSDAGSSFYVFVYEEDLSLPTYGYASMEDTILTQKLNPEFSIVSALFSGFVNEDIVSIPYFKFMDGSIVMVMGFEHEGSIWYVALRRVYESYEYSSTRLGFEGGNTEMIVLGTASDGLFVDKIQGYGTGSESPTALSVLKIAEQDVSLVDLTAETFGCFDDTVMTLADYIGSDDGNECVSNGATDSLQLVSADLDVSDVALTDTVFSSSGEMFVVGSGNAGSRFITQHGTESVFETDQMVGAIHPNFLTYDSQENEMVIVDTGIEGDSTTNIILYPLATTPTLY